MAPEGTITWGTRPIQASLFGHEGKVGAQHAFRHTKPHPGKLHFFQMFASTNLFVFTNLRAMIHFGQAQALPKLNSGKAQPTILQKDMGSQQMASP